jgi:hypothetical protein
MPSSSNHRLAPGEEPCVRAWGDRVVIDGRRAGFIIELEDGWGAFDPSGPLIGVRQRKPSALALVGGSVGL